MERDEQLRERIEELGAEARERLGAPPSPEQILAYHEGRLGPDERLAVEEGLAAFPDAARLLRDLVRFPDLEPAAGDAEPPDDEIDARWQEFRARRQPTAGARRTASSTPRAVWSWLRLAAVAVLAAGLGYAVGSWSRAPESRVNLASAALMPVGSDTARGGEAEEVRLAEAAEGLVLSLYYPQAPPAAYRLTVHRKDGDAVLERGGLAPPADDWFLVDLPPQGLTPGRYRIELTAPGAAPVVYELRLSIE